MKAIIIGCGNIGSVAAADLAKSIQSSIDLTVADKDEKKAEAIAKRLGIDNVSSAQLDVSDHVQLVKDLRQFDIVMGFLPGSLGFRLMKACIEAKKDMVDVSFMSENPLVLNEKALKADVTIVPDCGLAPGISNVLVGHAVGKLDKVQFVRIMVGGLPEKPIPPMEYTITWSPDSLIDEYTRRTRKIENGEIIEVEPLTGIEPVNFPNIGRLEAFFTDGLRTLMHTVKAEEMWEKTLRYPGHADKVKLLQTLGFFDEKQMDIDGMAISPRKLTARLLGKTLSRPNIRDFVALKIEVSGYKNGLKKLHRYLMLDRYDEDRHVTSMARTTAYPASIVAQMLLEEEIDEKGVVPPEKLGMEDDAFDMFLSELGTRGIKITEEKLT